MNQPWLSHYDAGVPQSIGTYPRETLASLVAHHAKSRPNDIAITFKGTRLTYAEVEFSAACLARGLARSGIIARDRIALVMPNCPQFLISALALWRIGAIVHGVSPLYTEREMEEAFHAVEPDCVIALTPFYNRVKAVQSRTSVRRVIATNIKEYLPPVLGMLFTLLREKKDGHRIALDRHDIWLR